MTPRKLLFWTHLTTGCIVATVVMFLALTGILLAYKRQVIRIADRGLRPPAAERVQPRLPVSTLLSRARRSGLPMPRSIAVHRSNAEPVEFTYGRDRVVLVDPYTGRVLGRGSERVRAFFDRVEGWHRWFGMRLGRRSAGGAIVAAATLGFFLLTLTGPLLWIPRRWSRRGLRAVVWFRRSPTPRARDYNWHHVAGIWCALPLLLISASGVVMAYPWANNLLYQLTGNPVPAAKPRPAALPFHSPAMDAATMDALWSRARQQVPGWRTITLQMPAIKEASFLIDRNRSGNRPDLRSTLTLKTGTAAILSCHPFSANNAGYRMRRWMRRLHTGEAFGAWGATIAVLASIGAILLAFTGFSQAFRRLRSARRRARTPAAAVMEVRE